MAYNKSILLINDDEDISRYLREELIINGGYAVSFESTALTGIETLKRDAFDLIIAKFGVIDSDGPNLVKGLKKADPDCVIVVFLEKETHDLVQEMANLGVYDFFVKPLDFEKIFFLIKKGMEMHSLVIGQHKLTQSLQEQNMALQKQNVILVKRLEESTKNLTRLYEDLRSTYMRTIRVLAQAIDARDHYTHSHSQNVAKFAVTIAEDMHLSAKEIEMLREACELHDLGKIGISDSILMKPSSLTSDEWEQIKRHPLIGAQILEPLTFLNAVTELVRQHHEHFDGTGYPDGKKDEDILLGARIIHLADAYEAMTSARSYRQNPLSKEEAVQEIKKNSGTQFDPDVVETFLRVVNRF